jgi:hypothetical protein
MKFTNNVGILPLGVGAVNATDENEVVTVVMRFVRQKSSSPELFFTHFIASCLINGYCC